MIVLGIDPGSVVCGYGVVRKDGAKLHFIEYGVIEAKKKTVDFNLRLKEIYSRLSAVVDRNKPDIAVFEQTFFSNNVQSLIKLSHARSAAMLAVLMKDVEIAEYSAREVKKAVTGRGAAGKEQVQYMVKNLLGIEEDHKFYDATDALAIAICHILKSNMPTKSSKSWADYIKQNPDKVIK